MLHSTFRNCSSRHKAYCGSEDASSYEEKIIQKENEITSTILGPLDFLNPAESYVFLCKLSDNCFPENAPINANLSFWAPRKKKNTRLGKGVEPDAFFTYEFADKSKRHFLIEIKWNSEFIESQLIEQWSEYLEDEEKTSTTHIFIAKNTLKAINSKNMRNIGANGHNLIITDWLAVRSALNELKSHPTPLGRWAKLADRFLEKSGVTSFGGFGSLTPSFSIEKITNQQLFWRPRFFSHKIYSCFSEVIHEVTPLMFNIL